jgi:hypothetical protein
MQVQSMPVMQPMARPLAILQTGEYPLWFQLTNEGPVLLNTIEDAIFSVPLIPWPFALYISFFQERDDELIMVINRYGFMKLAPYKGFVEGIALYRFSNEIFRQYTIGGFVFYKENPTALLYLDERFLDTGNPLPHSRTWTFNMESNIPFPLEIPALEIFPADEGWDIDTLRLGSDGYWYYRARKDSGPQPAIRILRTANLIEAGENTSLGAFQNSAPGEPVLHEKFPLPPLPDGYVYTGTGRTGDSLFAAWEEQDNFFIGAAGFMVMKYLKDADYD